MQAQADPDEGDGGDGVERRDEVVSDIDEEMSDDSGDELDDDSGSDEQDDDSVDEVEEVEDEQEHTEERYKVCYALKQYF